MCRDIGIALIREQINSIAKAGPAAAIFITNDDGAFLEFHFPTIPISPKDAPVLLKYIASSSHPMATIKLQ